MLEHLARSLEGSLAALSPMAVLLAFAGGAVTGLNPCTYPTIPVLIGLIGADADQPSRWRPVALAATFVVGLGLTYAILGATFSTVGRALGLSQTTWAYVVAAICLVFGLSWAGVITLNFRTLMPAADYRPRAGSFVGALALGLLFGLVASPCATPILAVILSAAAAQGTPLLGAVLLFAYAVGHGLPLLLIGCFAGFATRLRSAGETMATIQKLSGWVLVAVAFYLIWSA